MNDLDDRLREILEATTKEATPQFIAQIKQAFEEAGWSEAVEVPRLRYEPGAVHGRVISQILKKGDYMTGAEWYQRFEKEFNPTDTDCAEFYVGEAPDGCPPDEHYRRSGRFEVEMEAHEAAKKASNI